MKAFFFAKPLEYRLETPQEQLTQGETLAGTLSATNRGAAAQERVNLDLALAYGIFRELKAGGRGFAIVERRQFAAGPQLGPGESHSEPWRFHLASDCPITSKQGSLFLLYGGDLDIEGGWSRIDLAVALSPSLEALVGVVENHFYFAERGRGTTSQGFTEVRFKPPGRYPTMEEMQVRLRLREQLEVVFRCKMKGLSRGPEPGVRSRWVEVAQTHDRAAFLDGGGRPSQPFFRDLCAGVLEEITPAFGQPG